jgi:hypothetical protein
MLDERYPDQASPVLMVVLGFVLKAAAREKRPIPGSWKQPPSICPLPPPWLLHDSFSKLPIDLLSLCTAFPLLVMTRVGLFRSRSAEHNWTVICRHCGSRSGRGRCARREGLLLRYSVQVSDQGNGRSHSKTETHLRLVVDCQ